MTEIRIGERKIPMLLTTFEMVAIQREIGCTAAQLKTDVFGLETDEEDPKKIRLTVAGDGEKMEKLGKLIRILGNAGLEEKGEAADLEDKWVLRHMRPGNILGYAIMAMTEINEGLSMETAKKAAEERTGPVDVLLEEENAKKEPGN